MPSKAEQTEATRRALLGAARALFAERGFAETSTEAVVQKAGVTRGALYHHFRDKTDLFAAVFEDIERELVEQLAARATATEDPVALIVTGVEVFLEACMDPAVRRVVMLEGPTVLGWERWHEIEESYGLGLTRTVLQMAVDAGALRPVPVDPMAHLLLGALVEAAMLMSTSEDAEAARAELLETFRVLVDALRT